MCWWNIWIRILLSSQNNVEKDEYKAFAQFEKSANMGHTEGINYLGYYYEYGIEVKKNKNKVFLYY